MSLTCGTYPTPRFASSSGGWFVTSASPSMILPSVTRRMPTRLLSSVLLPAPLGPMMATISPGPTASDTSRMTGTPPYPDVMCSARRLGAGRPSTRCWSSDEVSVNNLLLPPQTRHRPAADDFALRHDHDRVAQPLDHVKLVLDHQDRETFRATILDVVLDLLDDLRVHARHRLAAEQHTTTRHPRPHPPDHTPPPP